MKQFSVGVSMAWQIAAGAAANTRYRHIEKEHLFIGLFSLEKLVELGEEKFGLAADSWIALINEHRMLERLLMSYKIDTAYMRRQMRTKLVPQGYQHTDGVVHRSEECLKIFDLAKDLAESSGCQHFNTLHLLAAILKNPGEIVDGILKEATIIPHLFSHRIINLSTRKRPFQTHLGANEVKTIHEMAQSQADSILTIMFDDIVIAPELGSDMTESQFNQILSRHNDIIRDILNRTGNGEVIKFTGNGVMAAFTALKSAMRAALMIQKAFLDVFTFNIRIGLDVGTISKGKLDELNETAGSPVGNAYRIMKLAAAGHILISEGVYQIAAPLSSKDLVFSHLGPLETQDDESVINIYEVHDPSRTTCMSGFHAKRLSSDLEVLNDLKNIKGSDFG